MARLGLLDGRQIRSVVEGEAEAVDDLPLRVFMIISHIGIFVLGALGRSRALGPMRSDSRRGDCHWHREEHRYRSKVTNIPRSSNRSRQRASRHRDC
jgi:hypothetical protein